MGAWSFCGRRGRFWARFPRRIGTRPGWRGRWSGCWRWGRSGGGGGEPMERVLALGERRGAAAYAIRVALAGGTVSPPLLETIALLGRERTLGRIEKTLAI